MSNPIGMDKHGNPIRRVNTPYGFGFGACNVERTTSHNGYVYIKIYTKHRAIELHVTPEGQKIVMDCAREANKFEKEEFEREEFDRRKLEQVIKE